MTDTSLGALVTATEGESPSATRTNNISSQTADEDYSKEYEPVVRLAQVETKTGEEDEDVLFKVRSKLFRFSRELNEWKERGTGDVRILKHKRNKKIRLLMRREKTLKICLNHYVNPEVELKENVGSDRSWVWHGVDYADGVRDEALLAIRFRDSTNAANFKEAYDNARSYMVKLGQDSSADNVDLSEDAEAKGEHNADNARSEHQVEHGTTKVAGEPAQIGNAASKDSDVSNGSA